MSDPAWPSFTFRVNLGITNSELVGPKTNSTDTGIFHPDASQSSPDQGRTEKSNRSSTRSTWLPGLLVGENRALKHGDTFTVTGLKSLYIRDLYAVGYAPADRAYLEIV
jgi:hypothetical protein